MPKAIHVGISLASLLGLASCSTLYLPEKHVSELVSRVVAAPPDTEQVIGALRQGPEGVAELATQYPDSLLAIIYLRDEPLALSLLKCGFPIENRDLDDGTALIVACEQGLVRVVRELIERGADLNATTRSGYTPLMMAVHGDPMEISWANFGHPPRWWKERNYDKILRLLLKAGADPTRRHRGEGTALDQAQELRRYSAVRILKAYTKSDTQTQ